MMTNKFSVLMSVYYKETSQNLKVALDSVINQSMPPNEIILVEDGKLTDDLYIKMNARGKALTDFENFKADFLELVKKRYKKGYNKEFETGVPGVRKGRRMNVSSSHFDMKDLEQSCHIFRCASLRCSRTFTRRSRRTSHLHGA